MMYKYVSSISHLVWMDIYIYKHTSNPWESNHRDGPTGHKEIEEKIKKKEDCDRKRIQAQQEKKEEREEKRILQEREREQKKRDHVKKLNQNPSTNTVFGGQLEVRDLYF